MKHNLFLICFILALFSPCIYVFYRSYTTTEHARKVKDAAKIAEKLKAEVQAKTTYYEVQGTCLLGPVKITVTNYLVEKGLIHVKPEDLIDSPLVLPTNCSDIAFSSATILTLHKQASQ